MVLIFLTLENIFFCNLRSTSTVTSSLVQWLSMLGCIALGGIAMLVKEQGITVFGVCVLYDVFVVNKVWKR
jgi:hypothetical protein